MNRHFPPKEAKNCCGELTRKTKPKPAFKHREINTRRDGRIFLLISILLMNVGACTSNAQESAERESFEKYRERAELKKLIEEGGVEHILVDVRTDAEYRSGHIPSAVNISVQRIEETFPMY